MSISWVRFLPLDVYKRQHNILASIPASSRDCRDYRNYNLDAMDCSQDGSDFDSVRRRNDRYIHSVRLCNSRRCFPYSGAQVHSRIRRTSRCRGDYTRFRRDFDTYAFPSFPYPFLCSFYIMYAAQNCAPFLLQTKKERGFVSSLCFIMLPDLLLLFLPVFFPEFP